MSTMVRNVFSAPSRAWLEHIQSRFTDARRIHLIPRRLHLDMATAMVFAHHEEGDSPSKSIVEPDKALNAAAAWALKEFESHDFLEDGYPNTATLAYLPEHEAWSGEVMRLSADTPLDEVRMALQNARPHKLVGLVAGHFVCDAFEGKSIAAVKMHKRLTSKDRYIINLRASHPFMTPEEISLHTNMQPDFSRKKGNGKKENYWLYSFYQENQRDISQEVAEILSWLVDEKRDFIHHFMRTGGSFSISAQLPGDANMCGVLTPALMSRAAQLGITLELEVFPDMK